MANTAVVTGIAGAIGAGIGSRFRAAGWHVIGVDVKEPAAEICDTFLVCDVSNCTAVAELGQDLRKKQTHINCLVNNAALQIEKSALDTSPEEWQSVINTNLSSAFYMTKALVPLAHHLSIVNISSVHAKATSPGMAAYVASKGGLSALTRALALELAAKGIRVNAVLPGAVESDMLKRSLARAGDSENSKNKLISATPLKKIGAPSDVAELVYFLADTKLSGNITGQEFVCDGGVLAKLASE